MLGSGAGIQAQGLMRLFGDRSHLTVMRAFPPRTRLRRRRSDRVMTEQISQREVLEPVKPSPNGHGEAAEPLPAGPDGPRRRRPLLFGLAGAAAILILIFGLPYVRYARTHES